MIGHNPKAHQHEEDFQDVAALLRTLPRVSAPTDFDAVLKARLATAKSAAQEFADVTALMQDLPRVAVPSDFNFKLKARIATAQSEQQKSSLGWFAEIFNATFSWAQAGAALAVVAFIVAGVTYTFMPASNHKPGNNNTEIATSSATVIPPVQNDSNKIVNVAPPLANLPQPIAKVRTGSPSYIKPQVVSSASHNIPPKNAVIITPAPVAPVERQEAIAAGTIMIKHTQSGTARLIKVSEYSLGQQAASVRRAPATQANVDEIAAQIY